MLIIGERINSSRRAIAEAISRRDEKHIRQEALAQASAGAHYIDVNAGRFAGHEEEHLRWLIEIVQDSVALPLSIDSPDPAVIRSVLPLALRPPVINSATLEADRCDPVFRLAAEQGARLVALCQEGGATTGTWEDRVRAAEKLVGKAREYGLALEDVFIDPLVYPLAANWESAPATQRAIREIVLQFPGVHTICGLSNISYGLPNRGLINRCFLVAAVYCGLDSVFIDPTDKELFAALTASLLICGRDEYCMGYITAFREGRL